MRLSVVTVHLEDYAALAHTQASLAGLLECQDVEWVVFDGGSRPESPAQRGALQAAAAAAAIFRSAADDGIYDGMNRAAAECAGDYLWFLNAGDSAHPDLDWQALRAWLEDRRPDMAWGRCFDRDREGRCYPRKSRGPGWLWLGMPVSHQAILFRREALPTPPYDPALRYAADYDLVCRLRGEGALIVATYMPLCVFDLVGRSSRNRARALAEEAAVRHRRLGMPAALCRAVQAVKLGAWSLHERAPALRAAWRRWV